MGSLLNRWKEPSACQNGQLHGANAHNTVLSSFKFHLLSLRRSVQDYKFHMDMEIVIFLESRGETNLEVYSNHMVQYSIWGFFPIQII